MAKRQPKVSIIIPVYNVERYIEECVRSLFSQTLDNIEYIFVDDCTPDKSMVIMERVLEEFPERKDQIKVIRHKPNEGVAKSRQDGVEAATGEYIIHCDPDDWVEKDMYEVLYNKAIVSNSDIVICNYSTVKDNQVKTFNQKPKHLSSISLLEGISGRYSKYIHGSTWNKLIKADYCKYAKFPSDISFCEDVFFWFQILKYDLKVGFVDRNLYYYRINDFGLVKSDTELDKKRNINLYRKIVALISRMNDNTYNLCCKSFICQLIYSRFVLNDRLSDREFKYLFVNSFFNILSNRRLGFFPKLILYISKYGYRSQAKNFIKRTQQIKKILKKDKSI